MTRHLIGGVGNCVNKQRHDSIRDARRILKKTGSQHGSRAYLYIYNCQRCGGYHIGSLPEKKETT